MAFPKIDTCIVCEGVRQEINNKHILLGFFGITPYVRVFIKTFQIPVSLCFVFCGGHQQPQANRFNLDLRLSDSRGNTLSTPSTSPGIKGAQLQSTNVTNVFFAFHGMLSEPGVYHVALLVNGVEHYATTVNIELPTQGIRFQ
jgi:hypothetical protein